MTGARQGPLTIEGCSLDSDGIRSQGDRYRELSRDVIGASRSSTALTVRFSAKLDEHLLEEAIAVERECCPFYKFDYEPAVRALTIGVDERSKAPALDALESALDPSRPRAH
jgi:hypothetical protein